MAETFRPRESQPQTAILDPERRFPSMFEPIRGSALDIAGKSIANSIGTLWSATLIAA